MHVYGQICTHRDVFSIFHHVHTNTHTDMYYLYIYIQIIVCSYAKIGARAAIAQA